MSYMYVLFLIYISVSEHVCEGVCVHLCVSVHVHLYVCVCMCTFVCLHVCVCEIASIPLMMMSSVVGALLKLRYC